MSACPGERASGSEVPPVLIPVSKMGPALESHHVMKLNLVRKIFDSGRVCFFGRIVAMATTYDKESPLENVVVFLIFFAVILVFCGGIIAIWLTT